MNNNDYKYLLVDPGFRPLMMFKNGFLTELTPTGANLSNWLFNVTHLTDVESICRNMASRSTRMDVEPMGQSIIKLDLKRVKDSTVRVKLYKEIIEELTRLVDAPPIDVGYQAEKTSQAIAEFEAQREVTVLEKELAAHSRKNKKKKII